MARYLITGGAGFIGVNAARYYAKRGHGVTLLDNFSRRGTRQNAEWIREDFPEVRVVEADVRTDKEVLAAEAAQCDVVLHLAAQVAVTLSVSDPRTDFDINARGTLNVLEAARQAQNPPIVLYSSTNKVYGGMEDAEVTETAGCYGYRGLPNGVSEEQPLDFHSPYGCSKGAADQYVRDYARIYGLRTIVFRQSCIYGAHQFGIEDQGWVAWFTMRMLFGLPVTIYGDGKQVRDVLCVDDLVVAFDKAIESISKTTGKIYNIGGGPTYTLSLLELIKLLEKLGATKMKYSFGDWRAGDQRVYISDVRKADRDFGWRPTTPPESGVAVMRDWMAKHQEGIRRVYAPCGETGGPNQSSNALEQT